MKTISLRVFRRTKDNISFLFNRDAVQENDIMHLKIYKMEDTKRDKELMYLLDINDSANTVQVVVDHKLNGLDPDATYIFDFIVSSTMSIKIRVYPTEVLPIAEKDDKKQNTHLFGWNEEEHKWVKLKAVKSKDGSYVLATKVVE